MKLKNEIIYQIMVYDFWSEITAVMAVTLRAKITMHESRQAKQNHIHKIFSV
jgi:hypothetical protein